MKPEGQLNGSTESLQNVICRIYYVYLEKDWHTVLKTRLNTENQS